MPEIRDASTDDDVRVEAWDAGSLVGHASARPVQLFHDERFCSVEVVPDRRREGIGTTLYAAVDALVPTREWLICRMLHSDHAESGFVDSIGYELIELCPAPIADPSDTAWRRWVADQPLPAGAQAVRSDAVPEADLESAFVDYYVWAHEMIGPLRPRADVAVASRGLASALDHDASTLVLREGRIVALSLVFRPEEGSTTRILAETTRVVEPDGSQLVAGAIAGTLDVLGRRGVALVELEGRTFDPHLPAVFASFPPHASNPMSVVRLQRRPLSHPSATMTR